MRKGAGSRPLAGDGLGDGGSWEDGMGIWTKDGWKRTMSMSDNLAAPLRLAKVGSERGMAQKCTRTSFQPDKSQIWSAGYHKGVPLTYDEQEYDLRREQNY
jgi:hypothetical protein